MTRGVCFFKNFQILAYLKASHLNLAIPSL